MFQKLILEKEDASSIPFPMTLMGSVVTFLWLLYGIVLLNYFMIVRFDAHIFEKKQFNLVTFIFRYKTLLVSFSV